ncbi:MAG: ABC-F family ATP-binding cassette domain-containing protein, partial [Lachnospiraceae bacterium]|nr:ABC-F family ATP-binding cassette domain-containing protein [Lachnospiraceae bacterium]
VALSRLLLTKPELAILDEPTNHLDVAGIEWLEVFLKNYPGAVLIVSHDRYFLDRVVDKVVELENGSARTFTGNYSAYAEKKAAIRSAELKAYLNQLSEIRHSEEVIDKLKQFNREKSIKRAESREKQLSKVERLEKPVELNDSMKLKISPSITSGRDVLHVEALSKSFPGNPLFDNISFDLIRGERVALIGNNGTGKTTMLKILTGSLGADAGEYTLGTNVHIGYYDQEHAVLNHSNTVFNEISDAYPDMNNTRIRNTLAAFLFTGDDVFKLIGELSGGEQGRVSLAKLMLSRANFLILDEPTNHLDMTSREILEEALVSYEGTVLFVSHDRYFINKCATRIFDLTDNRIIEYKGNYDYYLEKREELSQRLLGHETETGKFQVKKDASAGSDTSGKENWQEMKRRSAEARRRENEIKRCEEEIASLEERAAEIDAQLCDEEVARNSALLNELSEERAGIDERLEELMEQWETLQE